MGVPYLSESRALSRCARGVADSLSSRHYGSLAFEHYMSNLPQLPRANDHRGKLHVPLLWDGVFPNRPEVEALCIQIRKWALTSNK